MWYLTSEHDSRIIYVLSGQDVIIGRSADGQNCNFAVPGDASLSRKHASLTIADNKLNIQDLGSKYGTFINGSLEKVECNQNLILNENDIVKFGKMNCEWKVQKSNFVTCTSTLKGENIQNLRLVLVKLGGVLKSDWDESCAYLTMPAITLTIKVVLALVQGSYIVTTEYWNKCLDAVLHSAKLPDPNKFTPQIVETTLNKETVSFLPDNLRKFLFAGKKFIFFSKRQLDMYRLVLEKSSATALLLSETKMSKSMLCNEDVIVIQYNCISTSQDTETQREQIKDIANYLKNKGKRVVADAEIGLAVLYCSSQKYCNPDFNFTLEVMKQSSAPPTKVNNILAPDSQNQSQLILKQENIKIDESLTVQENCLTLGSDSSVTGKRKLDENEVTTNVTKKMATGSILAGSASKKRSADNSDDILINPSKKIAMETSVEEESFNFIKSTNKNTGSSTKLLNLMKPMKRKIDEQDDADGLFNFVTKKAATEQSTHRNSNLDLNNDDSGPEIVNINTSAPINEKVDITTLRGAKLSELMEQNCNMEVNNKAMKVIKSENDSEDFGSTVIVIRNDLIIKKDPLPIKEETETSSLKNFKKFKKVWPLKIQASMSKLTISV